MPQKMAFMGGFSDANYYSCSNVDLNDTAYTIGAVFVAGTCSGQEAIFSSLGTNTGYELRSGGSTWCTPILMDGGEILAGQTGVTTLCMSEGPGLGSSIHSRIMFLVLTSTNDLQSLYLNGTLVATDAAPTAAASVSNVFIGNRPGLGFPATNILVNSVFYADSSFTQAQIIQVYRWLQTYGRLPDDGIGGGVLTSITHFWDTFDNKTGNVASWVSRGATGGKTMTRTGTMSIASSGHAVWGW